ncbi:UNVERIFIED_CONTAM: hypothetical protein RF648_18520 [Kocuria sp. CPCC 205274]|uniref:Uncharacterized protein n=1 Tax=Herbiconiux daphne TaxID=2970914 RepID=A0ABT2HA01_9MICO|nr:hypothetical protein [Herbiconiux daphne]MCS5736706.1 hypothetical protein [Herbiconiux daphne]
MDIGLLVWDGGDGTSTIRFFRDLDKAQDKLEEDSYNCNEDVTVITVPDNFVPPGFWADEDDD